MTESLRCGTPRHGRLRRRETLSPTPTVGTNPRPEVLTKTSKMEGRYFLLGELTEDGPSPRRARLGQKTLFYSEKAGKYC
jgi:hypothetical protein